MDSTNRKSLSKVRLEQAKEFLKDAKFSVTNGGYKTAANRSYYTVFHSMRAVLALDGIDRKKHSAVISEFRKLYIKTKIFPNEMSDMITQLFYIRINSDYEDFYVVSKKEVKQQIANAEFFIREIEKYLKDKIKSSK